MFRARNGKSALNLTREGSERGDGGGKTAKFLFWELSEISGKMRELERRI